MRGLPNSIVECGKDRYDVPAFDRDLVADKAHRPKAIYDMPPRGGQDCPSPPLPDFNCGGRRESAKEDLPAPAS